MSSSAVVTIVLRCVDPVKVQARLWGMTFPLTTGVAIKASGDHEVVIEAQAKAVTDDLSMVVDIISRRVRSLLRSGDIHDQAAQIVSLSAVRDDR